MRRQVPPSGQQGPGGRAGAPQNTWKSGALLDNGQPTGYGVAEIAPGRWAVLIPGGQDIRQARRAAEFLRGESRRGAGGPAEAEPLLPPEFCGKARAFDPAALAGAWPGDEPLDALLAQLDGGPAP